jgi:IS5 family transposase
LGKARQLVSGLVENSKGLFRDRTISAKRAVKKIMDVTRQRLKKGLVAEDKADQMKAAYTKLIQTAEAQVKQTHQVVELLKGQAGTQVEQVRQSLLEYSGRVQQVISQTRRRVLCGESVPAEEKLVSLFEPHTAIIRKGKISQPTEFGRAVWLDEVEGGLISRYSILKGNPPEEAQLWASVEHHRQVFDKPPQLVAADRGVYSAAGEEYATEKGVKRVVIPKPGKGSPERERLEKKGWFKRGCNWRAGIEGRISGLKRSGKLGRCPNHGEVGMERWVGWGVISHDLWQIAKATA